MPAVNLPRLAIQSYLSSESEESLVSSVFTDDLAHSDTSTSVSSFPSVEYSKENGIASAPVGGSFLRPCRVRTLSGDFYKPYHSSAPTSPSRRPLPTPPPRAAPHSAPAYVRTHNQPRPTTAPHSTASGSTRRLPRPLPPRPLPSRPGPPPTGDIYAPMARQSAERAVPAPSPSTKPLLSLTIPDPTWNQQQRALLSGLPVTGEALSPLVFQKKFNRSTPRLCDLDSNLWFLSGRSDDPAKEAEAPGWVQVERHVNLPARQLSRKVVLEKKGKRQTQDTKDYHKVLHHLRKLR